MSAGAKQVRPEIREAERMALCHYRDECGTDGKFERWMAKHYPALPPAPEWPEVAANVLIWPSGNITIPDCREMGEAMCRTHGARLFRLALGEELTPEPLVTAVFGGVKWTRGHDGAVTTWTDPEGHRIGGWAGASWAKQHLFAALEAEAARQGEGK